MGQIKELMIEKEQEKFDRRIADKLGLSYEELIKIGYDIAPYSAKDGFVHGM